MLNQLTPKEVLDFMRKVSLMSLAVSDQNNQPQSHTMLFAIDDDFTMYFATSANSYKHKTMQYNNKVGISVWEDKKMLVQIQADVFELQGDEAVTAVDKLADVATDMVDFWPPVLQIIKKDYAVFKVVPKSIRALNVSKQTISNKEAMFTDIGAQL